MLIPDGVADRQVERGRLGCPVCGRVFPIAGGVARFGALPTVPTDAIVLTGESLGALLGIAGPGGSLALVGSLARLAGPVAEALEGVHVVAVDPPDGARVPGGERGSVLVGPTIPFKSRSLRGVALGEGFGTDAAWLSEAARVVLPGLRVVGIGSEPAVEGLEPIAAADGVWVARRAGEG